MAERGVEKCQTEGRDFDSTSVQTLLLLFVSDVEHPATHVEVAEWVKRQKRDPEVVGSTPLTGKPFCQIKKR